MSSNKKLTGPTAVAVFVKYPQARRVKTRLGEEIGFSRAAAIYQKMIEYLFGHLLSKLSPTEFVPFFFCDPMKSEKQYAQLLAPYPIRISMQQGEDLGARLHHSIEALLSGFGTVVVIGTDCLELTCGHLSLARKKLLTREDLVVGPAEDGGYYLIGVSIPYRALFENIPWGTPEVFRSTVSKAEEIGLSVATLPVLSDIDTLKDLRNAEAKLKTEFG